MHHIAFAVADRAAQLEVRKALMDTGYQVTPVIDRDYFWAIYFRTPGGVLFEVATNEPGFDRDEDTAHLGEALKLPQQHAHLRGVAGEAPASRWRLRRRHGQRSLCHCRAAGPRAARWSSSSTAPAATRTSSSPLVRELLPGAAIVAPRGDVSEHGAARFFRRTGEGVYDMADLAARDRKRWRSFVARAGRDGTPSPVVGLGYSNGANILAARDVRDARRCSTRRC